MSLELEWMRGKKEKADGGEKGAWWDYYEGARTGQSAPVPWPKPWARPRSRRQLKRHVPFSS